MNKINIKVSKDISIPPLGTRQVNVALTKAPPKDAQVLITIDPEIALAARLRLITGIEIVENTNKEQVLLVENTGGRPVFLYSGDIVAQMTIIKQPTAKPPVKPPAKAVSTKSKPVQTKK